MITLATLKDLDRIDEIAVLTINNMKQSNIPQWTLEYPRKKHYLKDIENNSLYVYKDNDIIIGAMTLLKENDPPYKTIDNWLTDKSFVIHRMIVDPSYRNQKVAQKLLNFACEQVLKSEYLSIKIDTHLENYKMRKFLTKNKFVEIGFLEVIDRLAYELVLKEDL